MKQIIKKWGCLLMVVLMLLSILSGCSMESGGTTPIDGIYQGSGGGETIRILSGSENKELGEILEQCAKETGVTIEMTYKGSVDIMTELQSGASAYIGFLYALLGKSEGLTEADLDDPELKEKITGLLSGIDRSSGSSDWLKEMFLAGDFDAMVNYECLIIDANNTLVEQGKEPLYVVYPYDGLSIADSPLGYVDHGDAKKQEAFLQIQEYLLSEEVQNEIQKTGRRTGFEGVAEENKVYFPSEWGINVDKVLSPISMPSEPVLMKALNLYQTSFRKPSLNVYCLDYSGSMQGEGNAQLVEAMAQVLLQENAEQNLLQAEQEEINIIIAFDDEVISTYMCEGNNAGKLEELYQVVAAEEPGGGTDMYIAAEEALRQISQISNLEDYTPAIILMTDDASETGHKEEFIQQYEELGKDIPIFSIMFGSAEPEQLEELAELTNARVFDGSKDLVAAFRSVKGYN